MELSDWISILAVIISFVSLAKIISLKSLDLRIEAKCADDDLKLTLNKLDEISKKAQKSRPRVASATGGLISGRMVQWKQDVEHREKRTTALRGQFAARKLDYDRMSPKKLEKALVELRRLEGVAIAISGEYESDLACDDEQRRQIREDIRANPSNRKSSFDPQR